MDIENMHYSFKRKLNKLDSNGNRNLLVPEIDWTLNEAASLFVKMIAMPRTREKVLGFESDQRSIEDIRTLVKNGEDPANQLDVASNLVTLPDDYWYFIRARVQMTKGNCANRIGVFYPRQHDDMFEESSNVRSSFEWRAVNGVFTESGIRLFDDGTFTNNKLNLSYIRKMAYMHYASGFRGGPGYSLPDGTALAGQQDCELPDHVHDEIVDLAVLIASGELDDRGYALRRERFNMNMA